MDSIVTNTDSIVTDTVGLLVAAIAVALVARLLRLPYTVGLVMAGIALALAHLGGTPVLTHDFIFDIILPPLLFEAGINIHWKALRRDAVPVLVLALFGTVIAAAAVAAGMVFVLRWPVGAALLFGALIAATDPIAVIAMFKDNGVTGRLRLLVESESLFNDGVAAVLFTLVFAFVQAHGAGHVTPEDVSKSILFIAGGGLFFGLVVGGAVVALSGRTADHLIESTLTTIAAYGSFFLAVHFGVSGVLSTVAAGLVVGNVALLSDGNQTRLAMHRQEFVLALWEFIAFIANSLMFLLIGLTVAKASFSNVGIGALIGIVVLTLVGRALTVYPLCLPFKNSRWAIPMNMQHVLWWGGLRGALGLALALSLPPDMEYRNEILIATFCVVTFSVVVQGLTMPVLLKLLGFLPGKARAEKRAG